MKNKRAVTDTDSNNIQLARRCLALIRDIAARGACSQDSEQVGYALQELTQVFTVPSQPLHLFDPRRNLQLQGFTRRGATTTIHDATETGVSISGIFQAAEDFAVLLKGCLRC